MHPTALQGFKNQLLGAYGRLSRVLDVLDVGGADVNGTVHAALRQRHGVELLDVLDVAPGSGVTIVGDATVPEFWRGLLEEHGARYDLVISTETLEHVGGWRAIVAGARGVLRPGGWIIGTCASIERRPHGARGALDPAAGEWYENVWPTELAQALLGRFDGEVVVEYNFRPEFPTTGDLYWRAQA
jgi:SAM-dependent methyltransferase